MTERMMIETIQQFVRFLDGGVSPFHVSRQIGGILSETGSRELLPGDSWSIARDEMVHVQFGGTVVAFRPGTEPPEDRGIVIGAAHTDSPGLQIKHRSATYVDGVLQVPVEVYGGPIVATWLDRELQLVGQVLVREENDGIRQHAVATRRPIGIIPNLAIHLNREANESLSYNRQDHLQVIVPVDSIEDNEVSETGLGRSKKDEATVSVAAQSGRVEGVALFRRFVAKQVGVPEDAIVDMELHVVTSEGASTVGNGDSTLVVSPRIDNLAGCFSVLEGFRRATHKEHGMVAIFFDHEEIGSATHHGAAGGLTMRSLRRFLHGRHGSTSLEVDRALERSLLVSNDCAHARHPNYANKHDAGYAPLLGGGPVIKKSAIRRYASELSGIGIFANACSRGGFNPQYLQNRSDIAAGSTIGPAVASRLSVESVDVGVPMLSMHSARETVAIKDVAAMATALQYVFEGGPQ
jgi:aspartyl aminopeptidase